MCFKLCSLYTFWIALTLAQKTYWIGNLFTHKNGGAIVIAVTIFKTINKELIT